MSFELASLKEYYNRCVRCGQCRSVCPVFSRLKTESASPRAKVFLAQLLASGDTIALKEAQRLLSLCLLCRSCTAECPSAIPVHRLITASRAKAAAGRIDSLKNAFASGLFSRPNLLALALAALSFCLPAAAIPGAAELLYPLSSLPRIVLKQRAKKTLPASTPPAEKTRLRVAYFIGCLTDLCFPEIARSTVNVLSCLGCEVIVPGNTGCCGAPLAARGQKEEAARLMYFNLSAIARLGADVIVTDCPTCALNLTETAQEQPGKKFKVYEAVQLAAELLPPSGINLSKTGAPVTYHCPCHLTHAIKAGEATRKALQCACEDFREMPDAAACCGGGGTFFLSHRQLSSRILKDKVKNIVKTGASVVATSCPLCQIQIHRGLREAEYKAQVIHPIQIIETCMGLKTPRQQ